MEVVCPPCACGCGEVVTYDAHRKKMNKFVNGHHNRVRKVHEDPTSRALRPATAVDLAWAAGFLEGEGSFCTNGKKGYPVVQAFQVEREPLDYLRSFFGGRLTHHSRSNPNAQDIWCWRANGTRARGIMFTLWPLMFSKRQGQIATTLVADVTITMRHAELAF